MDNTQKALAAMDEGRGKTVQPKNDAEAQKVRDLLPRSVETADDIDELLEALAPTKCGCGADEPCDRYGCGPLIPAKDWKDGDSLSHPEREHYEGPAGHWSENSAFYKCYHTEDCPAHKPHPAPDAWNLETAEGTARRSIAATAASMPDELQKLKHDPARYFRILDSLIKASS